MDFIFLSETFRRKINFFVCWFWSLTDARVMFWLHSATRAEHSHSFLELMDLYLFKSFWSIK